MKINSIILTCIALFAFSNAEAQFFDKLKKEVEKSAERTVVNKSGDKTSEEVGQGFDGLFSKKKKKKKEKKKKDNDEVEPKNQYSFSYKYSMKMSSKDGEFLIDYYLKPNADYIGAKFKSMESQGMDMFMVMDTKTPANHMFMDMNGGKMVRSSTLPESYLENQDAEEAFSKYTITPMPNKKILGYNCKGVKMENDEWEIVFYYTNEVGASFNSMFGNGEESKNIPDEMKEIFLTGGNNLIMSMMMTDKKKNGKRNGKMQCIALDEINFTFKTKEYRKMGW